MSTVGSRPYTAGMVFYGHGSWIALVVFGAVFAMRALSSQRRRGGRPGGPGPHPGPHPGYGPGRSFTSGHRPPTGPPGSPSTPSSPTVGGQTGGTAPGWFTDPFVKHEQRYWSGTAWTEHVMDNGAPGTDPPPPGRGRDVA